MYAVCQDSNQVALTLKRHLDNVKMVLIGPGLVGNGVTVARMLGSKAHIVMVVDPSVNPLGPDPETYTKIQHNLEELGVIIVLAKDATNSFYQPLIQQYVLSGMAAGADFGEMSPEERAAMIDKRLEAVNSFPLAAGHPAQGRRARRPGPTEEMGRGHRSGSADQDGHIEDSQQRPLRIPLPRRNH